MQVQIQKWGNSLAICIPDAFAKEIKAHQGEFLELSSIGKNLILTPVVLHAYSLDSLLSQVNEDNLHQEIDLGNEVGKEIW
jgi:antitoxin MazE